MGAHKSPTLHSRRALDVRRREAARRRARYRVKVVGAALAVALGAATYAVGGPASKPASGDTGAVRPGPTAATARAASLRPRLLFASASPFPSAQAHSPEALAEDQKGPLFRVSGGKVRRFSAARPGRGVALIFDDGPGPQTETVLRELERAGARATFFSIGEEAVRRPELLKRLRSAGMEIGNHSWSHRPMPSLDRRGQQREIAATQSDLERLTGKRPRFFRPPEVMWNEETARAASAEGTIGVLHTVETWDWALPGSQAIVSAAEAAEAGDVIALHDAGGDRSQTIAAVRPIVRALRRKGLRGVSVGELTAGGEGSPFAVSPSLPSLAQ